MGEHFAGTRYANYFLSHDVREQVRLAAGQIQLYREETRSPPQ
jgi:hypothetical protein